MLKLKNISFSYGDKKVLDNFSLELKASECVCLFGESGCGKTTVSRLILGLEKAQSGEIEAPKKISCVFQENRLLPNLDVFKNICLNIPNKNIPLAERLLQVFGLESVKNARISDLSGGMKRRVAIIRAICHDCDVLILDEAFNGIDTENKTIITRFLKDEFLAGGKAILMISHIDEDIKLMDAKVINM